MYIALFSHFIPCGVQEAVYILDGLIQNASDIQPDTVHGDTQAQSAPVFGLAYLLGINLMPRIRDIKDLLLTRPTGAASTSTSSSLFRASDRLGPDRTAFPGHAARRDFDQGRPDDAVDDPAPPRLREPKNKLYFAFRELGRVIRTMFLLRTSTTRKCAARFTRRRTRASSSTISRNG